jgi:hypothetical protein
MADTKTADAIAKNPKLAALLLQKSKIDERIAQIKAREQGIKRKEETHLKVLVGAALLADAVLHPDIHETIKTVLARAVKDPRDIEFLKTKGWL